MGLTTFWKMISYVVGRSFWTHSENDCHHACTKINYILNIKDNKMNQSLLRFFNMSAWFGCLWNSWRKQVFLTLLLREHQIKYFNDEFGIHLPIILLSNHNIKVINFLSTCYHDFTYTLFFIKVSIWQILPFKNEK